MKQTCLVSFSGGRSSAYMLYLLLTKKEYFEKYNYVYLFANTGKEREETLVFVEQCAKHWNIPLVWLEAVPSLLERKSSGYKVVDFESANRTGIPFQEVIKKYGIPNQSFPHCTRELKQNPLKNYLKDTLSNDAYKDYVIAAGIRVDEPSRIKMSSRFIYPLYDHKVTNKHVRDFWNSMPFDLRLRDYEGNCDLCWKKSENKKLQLIRDNPKITDWWLQMEAMYSDDSKDVFNRGYESITDLIQKAPDGKSVIDKSYADRDMSCACMLDFPFSL